MATFKNKISNEDIIHARVPKETMAKIERVKASMKNNTSGVVNFLIERAFADSTTVQALENLDKR